MLIADSAQLMGFKVKDANNNYVSLKQDKLFVSYLNIPLLFEFQTNPKRNLKSFHVSLGVIGGVRLCSYSKQKYNSIDQTYYLVDDKGNRVASYSVNDNVVRSYGAYHLSPFKLDASFRIGWSFLNLFSTYELTPMFQNNQAVTSFLTAFTVSRAMIFAPIAACIATSYCWRGMNSLSFSQNFRPKS